MMMGIRSKRNKLVLNRDLSCFGVSLPASLLKVRLLTYMLWGNL